MASLDSLWVFISLMLFHNGFTYAVDVREMSIDEYVNYINPPAVHRYQNKYGDSILCVKYSDQISVKYGDHNYKHWDKWCMDHARLNSGLNTSGFGVKSECPEDTVAIMEIKREDVERAGSVDQFVSKRERNSTLYGKGVRYDHEWAVVQFQSLDHPIKEAKASFNIWSPHVTSDSVFSLSQIWISNNIKGSDDKTLETVEAGWMVSPSRFGDEQPRLFSDWTPDGYENGCLNLACPGFVIARRSPNYIGQPLEPISSYGGPQREAPFHILKVEEDGIGAVWALYVLQTLIGYWPTSLFKTLADSGNRADFGGEVAFAANAPGTPLTQTDMGSGHFPLNGFKYAAYVRDIKIFGAGGQINPVGITYGGRRKCYDAIYIVDEADPVWNKHLFFGGPGGDHVGCVQ